MEPFNAFQYYFLKVRRTLLLSSLLRLGLSSGRLSPSYFLTKTLFGLSPISGTCPTHHSVLDLIRPNNMQYKFWRSVARIWAGWRSRCSNSLRTGRSGDQIQVGARLSAL